MLINIFFNMNFVVFGVVFLVFSCEFPEIVSQTTPAGRVVNRQSSGDGATTTGQVQMSRIYNTNPIWHSVCATGFSDTAATLACRDAGFSQGIMDRGLIRIPEYSIVTDSIFKIVSCTGQETSLPQCRHERGPKDEICPDAALNIAQVICGNAAAKLGVPPSQSTPTESVKYKVSSKIESRPGPWKNTGYILLTRNGIQAPVCIRTFDDKAANVVCKAAGFQKGVLTRPSENHQYKEYLWTIQFRCSGLESSLTDCQKIWSDDYRRHCSSGKDLAKVFCYNSELKFRLGGGSSPRSGRVELNHDGTWGGVCCASTCSDKLAQVACKQLGFMTGSVISAQSLTGSTLSGFMYLYDCPDGVTDLWMCKVWWGRDDTSHHCNMPLAVQCVPYVTIEGGTHTGVLNFGIDNKHHQVCRDSFTDKDAAVACRAAGFSGQGKSVTCGNFPIKGSQVIGRFECTGQETKLRDCKPVVTPIDSCASRLAAVISCVYDSSSSSGIGGDANQIKVVVNGPQVSTADYRAAAGSVRLSVSGVEFRIGAQGWDDNDARVACTSLKYGFGVAYKRGLSDQRVPFIADNVGCGSTTTNFMDCLDKSKVFTPSSCNTTIEAGVFCIPSANVVPEFTLVKQNSGFAGRLSISVLGKQGAVCQDGFTDIEATVACRKMGRKRGRVSKLEFPTLPSVVVEGVKCSGQENNLMDCVWGEVYGDRVCPSQRQVALECYDDVYISDGYSARFGMVQISREGGIYAACDENFDDNAAKVVCKGLGFVDGIKVCCQPFGAKSNQVFLNNVRCTGSEKSLLNCPYDTAACSSGRYASVYCFTSPVNTATAPDAVLTGTSESSSGVTGEVALAVKGVSGRVCRDSWDDTDASVLCKRFGFVGGVAYQYARKHDSPIVWGGFNCTGSESLISDCPYTNVARTGGCNDYTYSAGVLCYKKQAPTFRLAGGSKSGEGRVEVNYDGVWGTVCNQLWSRHDAAVLCKHLSSDYVDGAALSASEFGAGTGPVYMTEFNCTGAEKTLFQCVNAGWKTVTTAECTQHKLDAAVRCRQENRRDGGGGVGAGSRVMAGVIVPLLVLITIDSTL